MPTCRSEMFVFFIDIVAEMEAPCHSGAYLHQVTLENPFCIFLGLRFALTTLIVLISIAHSIFPRSVYSVSSLLINLNLLIR